MEAKKTILQLRDFVVINSSYTYQQFPTELPDVLEIQKTLNSYVVDIDFAFRNDEPQKDVHLFTKISINQATDSLPGHVIFAESVTFIDRIAYDGLNEDEKVNQVNIPAINIAINLLRGYFLNMTAYSPLGKYVLPGIDLNDLIKAKAAKRASTD